MFKIIDVGCVYYLVALVLAVVLWFIFWKKKISKRFALSILLPYLFLVIISTVITRRVNTEQHLILSPFWTIKTILLGGQAKVWLVKEVVLNILMLMPVGVLSPLIFEKRKILCSIFVGTGISLLIEVLQFCFYRGHAEIDDLIFNTFGVLIGLGIYFFVMWVRNRVLH
ncbi:MAG: VanZ family protein [Saccharofermentans sp.]|nr:VanZ family protein [Saccharofermentans sp.]